MKENLTRDASGQYRRELDWKKTGTGYAQLRFCLGRDRHVAAIAVARLEKLYHDIETQWERDRLTYRPM